jgi:hypothetical protein
MTIPIGVVILSCFRPLLPQLGSPVPRYAQLPRCLRDAEGIKACSRWSSEERATPPRRRKGIAGVGGRASRLPSAEIDHPGWGGSPFGSEPSRWRQLLATLLPKRRTLLVTKLRLGNALGRDAPRPRRVCLREGPQPPSEWTRESTRHLPANPQPLLSQLQFNVLALQVLPTRGQREAAIVPFL